MLLLVTLFLRNMGKYYFPMLSRKSYYFSFFPVSMQKVSSTAFSFAYIFFLKKHKNLLKVNEDQLNAQLFKVTDSQ